MRVTWTGPGWTLASCCVVLAALAAAATCLPNSAAARDYWVRGGSGSGHRSSPPQPGPIQPGFSKGYGRAVASDHTYPVRQATAACGVAGCGEPACGSAAPACGCAGGCDGGCAGPCEPGCGVAGPSCGVAGPSCGVAGPSCGVAGPSCGVAGPSCGVAGPSCGVAGPSCGSPGGCCVPDCGTCKPKCRKDCPCGPPGRFWVRADALLWWTKGADLPPLITTSPEGTSLQNAGVIGRSGTQVLYGDEEILTEERWGGRIRFGGWLDCCQHFGFEGDYFALDDAEDNFFVKSFGFPILARPFCNIDTGEKDAEIIAFRGDPNFLTPDDVAGMAMVSSTSSLQGAGARFICNLCCKEACCTDVCTCCGEGGRSKRLDFIGGYRFMRLDEDVWINENLMTLTEIPVTFDVTDHFDAKSEFHGAEIGLVSRTSGRRYWLETIGKVALGNSHHVVNIDGRTTVNVLGVTETNEGGLLAQPNNLGEFTEDEFAVIPEASVTLGYRVTPNTSFTVGYTFIYWSSVVRAADQIDLNVDPDLLPPITPGTPLRDDYEIDTSDYWAMGLNLGLEHRW